MENVLTYEQLLERDTWAAKTNYAFQLAQDLGVLEGTLVGYIDDPASGEFLLVTDQNFHLYQEENITLL